MVRFHMYEISRLGQFIGIQSQSEGLEGVGNKELLFNGDSIYVGDDERVLGVPNGDGCSL